MLKLKTPIKTVLNPELISSSESFAERILGNYRQLGVELNPTDLLHVTNEPPEVFVMDGGMTSLFSSANVENIQIQKTQIINNLINRILLSADSKLSYQDNVYVTNVLHKLGIKDEKTFLKEAQRLFLETKEQHEAVQLYWENLETLQTLIKEYKTETKSEVAVEEEGTAQPVLHLHEEVNNRLQTAAIYRVLQNFYENSTTPRVLTNELMMIQEQSRLSREILLTRLREEVRMEPTYLTYRHENFYEGDELSKEEVSVESVSTRISSAVLLNLIDNIYDSVYSRMDHHLTNWFSTESTYYKSAENTLFRIEQNTAYLQYLFEQSLREENQTSAYVDEVNMLQQLLSVYESSDIRLQQSLGGNVYDSSILNQTEFTEEMNQTLLQDISSAEMVHISNETSEENNTTEVHGGQSVTQEINQIYQQNIVRNQQYLNALQKIVEQGQTPETTEDRSRRMLEESRLSLENPEEFMREYQAADQRALETTENIIRESEKLLSSAQQVAHEIIREYMKAPERFYHSEIISEGNLGVLLYDIQTASTEENIPLSEGREEIPFDDGTSRGGTENNDLGNAGDIAGGEIQRFQSAETIYENEVLRERSFSEVMDRVTENVGAQMVFHQENILVSNITDRVIERWHERRERPAGFEISYEESGISMVHRSKETVIDEDVIESMQQQIRQIETTQQSVTESTKYQETENRTVINDIVNETIEHNTQAITDIVNSSVKKQLDEISDKVYGRIERQLKNEKRRRGL